MQMSTALNVVGILVISTLGCISTMLHKEQYATIQAYDATIQAHDASIQAYDVTIQALVQRVETLEDSKGVCSSPASVGKHDDGDESSFLQRNVNTNSEGSPVAVGEQHLMSSQKEQGTDSVAIGTNAGEIGQKESAVAIGHGAGQDNQGGWAIAVGKRAGETAQAQLAIAVGEMAGNSNQGVAAVAVGHGAGHGNQGESAIAIGQWAGNDEQGKNSIAIGSFAGRHRQGAGSVVISGGVPDSAFDSDSRKEGHISLRSAKADLSFTGGPSGKWTASPKLGSDAVEGLLDAVARILMLESMLKHSYEAKTPAGYCKGSSLCPDKAELGSTCENLFGNNFLTDCDEDCATKKCDADSACVGFTRNNEGHFKLMQVIEGVQSASGKACFRKK